MESVTMYIPAPTPALNAAASLLQRMGVRFTGDAQEAEYLLYSAPTPLSSMADYTTDQTIIGGNLDFLNDNVARLDLLKDPYYLCRNAAITAEAALGMILSNLKCSVTDARILILGWGRIGKSLTHQLHHLNASVTVYARKHEDRAMLRSLGYHYTTLEDLRRSLPKFHCIVNTAPASILTQEDARRIRPDCCCLELSSGDYLPGSNVITARGLPGKCKPEASGALIAETIRYHLGGR